VHFAAELAGELQQDRAQPVGDGKWIGGDRGCGQFVNQVNKTGGRYSRFATLLVYVVATITRRQKSLALIRAREVATNLSLPIAVLDADGDIVFYNEAAEAILGDTFEAAGELSSDQWAAAFSPEREDGTPIRLHELPGGVALLERRPHHVDLFYTSIDGVRRNVALTGFPLVGRDGELFGAFTIFWHI
jgi:PAS domain-containing protein